MRKKILILTLNDGSNYGNRLQNYALKKMLDKYGDVSTIQADADGSTVVSLLKHIAKRKIVYVRNVLFRNKIKYARLRKIQDFTSTYVPDNGYYASPLLGLRPKENHGEEIIVLGSDQIWNPRGGSLEALNFRLGGFCDNQRIISYAASTGQAAFPDACKAVFEKNMKRMSHISVREFAGKAALTELVNKSISVVLDPTLMLTAKEWLQITKNFVPDTDRYILTYFLGHPSDEQERNIQMYAKQHNCRVRRMLDLDDRETYVAGPQDFVELFSKAQYVFTDSYHACCFSILFHKQFTVFNRAGMTGKTSMNSRMETLFCLFNLNSVMMDSGLAPEIDYGKVDQLLEQHRKESQDWLDKAMKE